jgi:hypothetical protein
MLENLMNPKDAQYVLLTVREVEGLIEALKMVRMSQECTVSPTIRDRAVRVLGQSEEILEEAVKNRDQRMVQAALGEKPLD